MKCGPSPSRTLVDAGVCTQLRLKNELPIAKRVRSSSLRFAAGKENAFLPSAQTVVAPPVSSSGLAGSGLPCSGLANRKLAADTATRAANGAWKRRDNMAVAGVNVMDSIARGTYSVRATALFGIHFTWLRLAKFLLLTVGRRIGV